MSSMIKHLDFELKFVPQYADVRKYVVPILEVISAEGHSGHSFGWFANVLEDWLKDPKDLGAPEDPNELFSIQRLMQPIWALVKDIPAKELERVSFILMRAARCVPFTPLTGEDDEWVIHGYEGCYAQNRRMGSVFKEKDGSAYWSEGIVHGHPSDTYRWFLYYQGSYSRVPITFPWDASAKTQLVHFSDPDMEVPLDVGGDPQAWLKAARHRLRLGFDPLSGVCKPEAWITNDSEERTEVVKALQFFSQSQVELDEKDWDTAVSDALCMEFETRTSKIAYFDHPVEFKYADTAFSFTNGRSLRNFVRLVEEIGLGNLKKSIPEPVVGNILVPSKHYQRWDAAVNEGVLVMSNKSLDFYMDAGQLLNPDFKAPFNHLKYLRDKCKERGLEYKGAKH